jgi:hypothetical protein
MQVTRFGCRFAVVLWFCAGLHSVSHAADPRYPDWPCVQAKVPEISVAAVWDGPPIEQAADTWQSDSAIKDMVARLAARRTSMEEAQKSIVEFLSGDAAKADKGKRLASRVEWSTRIFEDRRRSIRYACEVPVIIERRLFALSRTIQQTVEQ